MAMKPVVSKKPIMATALAFDLERERILDGRVGGSAMRTLPPPAPAPAPGERVVGMLTDRESATEAGGGRLPRLVSVSCPAVAAIAAVGAVGDATADVGLTGLDPPPPEPIRYSSSNPCDTRCVAAYAAAGVTSLFTGGTGGTATDNAAGAAAAAGLPSVLLELIDDRSLNDLLLDAFLPPMIPPPPPPRDDATMLAFVAGPRNMLAGSVAGDDVNA